IAIWGSPPPLGRREYSAMKFLIFTLLGSAFMLVGILALYFSTGTFDMLVLSQTTVRPVLFTLPAIFWLIFAGFAVKLPMIPLHTWLPDAHTDAPTAVSVILAGVLLKMGGYGMIRVGAGIFPGVVRDFAWILALLAVVAVLYGAIVTLRQRDLKRLIAYSSVSHMGYVLLGIAAMNQVGLAGASLQMFTHGTITGLLFALVGLLYDKAHTRQLPELGGLVSRMPFIAVAMTIAGLASLGLPGLSGFASEFLVFMGAFSSSLLTGAELYAILGVIGIAITAGYILWMIQRAFFGPAKEEFGRVPDATFIEGIPVAALIIATVVIGVYPALLTDVINLGVAPIVGRLLG
ncbi:MAG: NADH-quinone oxidoreductase subunit M, partial [Dehalococcoidia bacterium]|nr:NADH-quinone oxidoreductase subunit M [Dehalococcoidia bacterium]